LWDKQSSATRETKMQVLTSNQIFDMRQQGRAVFVHPKKLLAVVDGFKRYQVTRATIDMLKKYNYGKIN